MPRAVVPTLPNGPSEVCFNSAMFGRKRAWLSDAFRNANVSACVFGTMTEDSMRVMAQSPSCLFPLDECKIPEERPEAADDLGLQTGFAEDLRKFAIDI